MMHRISLHVSYDHKCARPAQIAHRPYQLSPFRRIVAVDDVAGEDQIRGFRQTEGDEGVIRTPLQATHASLGRTTGASVRGDVLGQQLQNVVVAYYTGSRWIEREKQRE